MASRPPWRIGVDVGGTFTDLVVADGAGTIRVFKVPSTPTDPAEGVLAALAVAADAHGRTVDAFLADCDRFVHGSTIATNLLLERKGAVVGMVTTAGFRDSLEIRRGLRPNPWDHRTPFPPVLAPRHLRLAVRGRLDPAGQEREPLAEADVLDAAMAFQAERVEAVAICLLHAYANPLHEQRVQALLERALPGTWISRSSEVAPVIGEYERGSTVVMNAYLGPRVVPYLRALADRLAALGLGRPPYLVQSNGGAMSLAEAARRPVNLVLSGPAAGVGALRHFRGADIGDDLIAMEIGGTSCDVTLMADGDVAVSEELEVDGYHLAAPAVDIHTVGAGGGTIAGVDEAGLLFAGPRGAGAMPGPAAYGRGGSEPTVTDAQLVLGRLRPGPYAGGSVTLDADAARTAIARRIADPLGITVEEAAAGIVRLVEQHLLQAVERISIQRGHDPRRFVLVACGGAGPMHGAAVGAHLGVSRVFVPRLSGAFCALGMLGIDLRRDFARIMLADLAERDAATIDGMFAPTEAEAREFLAAEGFDPGTARLQRLVDLRYPGQQWNVRVGIERGDDAVAVRSAFERAYDRQFGHIQPGGRIELAGLRVAAIGRLPPLDPPKPPGATGPCAAIGSRRIYVDATQGWRDASIYAGSALAPGHRLRGPAVIEEATTTILVGAGDVAEVDSGGDYVIHLGRGRDGD